MINLKVEPEKSREIQPSMLSAPSYPYGLCIELNHEVVEKLGIKKAPEVLSNVNLEAVAQVMCVRVETGPDGEPRMHLSLQITDMELKPFKKSDAAKSLYGDKD